MVLVAAAAAAAGFVMERI